MSADTAAPPQLKRTLGPLSLWGLGVGYVISGEYFGWNLGLPLGGSLGMLIAFVIVTTMYITFVLSYVELACAIPKAGGGFVYGVRGLGRCGGYFTGVAQVVEFIFAPPAIAMAIGAYAATWRPGTDPRMVALVAFVAFTALNLWGVQQAAAFELIVTLFAVGEILLFTGAVAPHVSLERFAANGLPNGVWGIIGALPFAIWFYLAIEGVANAAEEARNPQRDVAIGFGSALATLVVLASSVLVCAVGVGGWEQIVWTPGDLVPTSAGLVPREGAPMSDSPLPLALGQVFSSNHTLYHLLIGVGALGLISSLNGIILIASRALFEMGRAGFLPRRIGKVHPRTHAPANALLLNLVIGAASILFLDTGRLITLAAMGAVTLYVLSMVALVRLRTLEPDLPRPFRTPWYPIFPRTAQSIAAVCLAAMLWQNFSLTEPLLSVTLWYAFAAAVAAAYYGIVVHWQPDVAANEAAVELVETV